MEWKAYGVQSFNILNGINGIEIQHAEMFELLLSMLLKSHHWQIGIDFVLS
jgi:hypothetical protein